MPTSPETARRVSVRELGRTPSHLYQRLLRGEINSMEYVRILKRAVDMRVARD